MPDAPSLVCIGNLTIDEAVSPAGRAVESVGGDALFAALAARLAGGNPTILAPLGNDATPDSARRDPLGRERIPPRCHVATCPPFAMSSATTTPAGGCGIWSWARAHFEALSVHPADVSDAALAAAGILLSAMALHAQLAAGGVAARPHRRRESTSIRRRTTSPDTRPLCGMPSERCDVFLPSQIEAAALAGTSDLHAAAATFLELGPTGGGDQTRRGRLFGRDPERPEPTARANGCHRTGGQHRRRRRVLRGLRGRTSAQRRRVRRGRSRCAAARIAVGAPGIDGLLAAVTRGGADDTRITVINPNTSAELTATITKAAQAVAGTGVMSPACTPPRACRASKAMPRRPSPPSASSSRSVRTRPTPTRSSSPASATPASTAAREVATCPVVGMTEAALQTACLVAHRFVVITMPARTIAHSDRVVRALGLEHRCTVTAVDVRCAELVDGSTHLLDAFAEAARGADQAEAVVLGCAGLADLVDPLSDRLGMPVIDGVAAGVGIAAGLVAMGLNTSRANTFAPGDLDAMTVLFRQVFVYDAAAPDAMTGPIDVLVEDDRISAVGDGLAAPGARIVEGRQSTSVGARADQRALPFAGQPPQGLGAQPAAGAVHALRVTRRPGPDPDPAGGLSAHHARRDRDAAARHHHRAGRRLPDALTPIRRSSTRWPRPTATAESGPFSRWISRS